MQTATFLTADAQPCRAAGSAARNTSMPPGGAIILAIPVSLAIWSGLALWVFL